MSYQKTIRVGEYRVKASATYDFKLDRMPYASAGVNYCKNDMDADCYTLVSYQTPILSLYRFFTSTINHQFLVVGNVSVSPTTIKHVSAFLREYVPYISYQTCKGIYKTHDEIMAINLNTGEIIDANKVYDFFNSGYNDD